MNKNPSPADIAAMNLHEIEALTDGAAADKGFGFAAIADPATLEFPVRQSLLLVAMMAALERHRKGQDPAISGNIADEMQGLYEDFRQKTGVQMNQISSEKKYLIAKLMLIASEVGEAIEAVLGMTEDVPKTSQPMWVEEVADVVIRAIGIISDGKAAYPIEPDISVASATCEKIVFNRSRPPKHGNKLY